MPANRSVWVPFVFLAGAVTLHWAASEPPSANADVSPASTPFLFFHEFYGSGGYKDPQARQNYLEGLMNGMSFWPPADESTASVVDGSGGLILRMPAASGPSGIALESIEAQLASLASLAAQAPPGATFWNLMPEWDQSGGDWVFSGRPRYNGLAREEAFRRFADFYATAHPNLGRFLRPPTGASPPYRSASVTDHSANVFYAYEIGVGLQMLERGIDELGDLSTGIAYLRGAARQYGRPWGIDISTWRGTTNSATKYDESGQLRGGWSESYIERLYYLALAAGANVIHNEASTYRGSDRALNPLGEATRRFADFALRRNPGVGAPTVNVAMLIDPVSGFEPKHGLHDQANAVWYQDIPYSAGDYMTNNFFKVAFPGHWLHGLAPGAPFANGRGEPVTGAFEDYLARGGDPRPFEPMPTTRWGDNIDILNTGVAAAQLRSYKAIVLLGDVSLDARLRAALRDWVAQGGVLVMNAAQAAPADEELVGIRISDRVPRTASYSRWTYNPGVETEPAYRFLRVEADNADVLAVNESADALVTSRKLGSGEVLFTTPLHLQASSGGELLKIGISLLDGLFRRFEPVTVSGTPIEYSIGRGNGKVFITLANHRESPWNGSVRAPQRAGPARAIEYLAGETPALTIEGGEVVISITVPPFGVRVVAIEGA